MEITRHGNNKQQAENLNNQLVDICRAQSAVLHVICKNFINRSRLGVWEMFGCEFVQPWKLEKIDFVTTNSEGILFICLHFSPSMFAGIFRE